MIPSLSTGANPSWRRVLGRLTGRPATPEPARDPSLDDLAFGITLEPDDFTAHLAKLFRAALPGARVEVAEPLRLEIHVPGRPVETAPLGLLHERCQLNPEGMRLGVASHVALIAADLLARDQPLRPSQLRVLVRPTAHVYEFLDGLRSPDCAVAYQSAGDLWVMSAADRPTAIYTLGGMALRKMGLSPRDGLARGERNMRGWARTHLKALADRHEPGISLLGPEVYMASLFAFPHLWKPLARKTPGPLLVAVPSPDMVLVSSGGGAQGVSDLAAEAREALSHTSRPFSDQVFRWTEDGWALTSPD